MVVAGGGHWGMMSGAPPAALLPEELFPGKEAFCDFPSTKPAAAQRQGPEFSGLFSLFPSSLGCLLNANPSLATVIFQGLFRTGLGGGRTELFRNGEEERPLLQ